VKFNGAVEGWEAVVVVLGLWVYMYFSRR